MDYLYPERPSPGLPSPGLPVTLKAIVWTAPHMDYLYPERPSPELPSPGLSVIPKAIYRIAFYPRGHCLGCPQRIIRDLKGRLLACY
ncbi:hypothetical protein HBH46_058260 [Parastagonospora nodorum]|nr:hypothetical protein HBH46_058260 [Parastagonospora nodorum]